MTDYYAYDAGLPCRNPNCKSRGKPHPNCQCWAGSQRQPEYAHGGSVCASNQPHEKGCAYYAEGGSVQADQTGNPPDDIHSTLGMAGAHHGLLGLLREVGHPRLADPEVHTKHIDKIKGGHKDPLSLLHGSPLAGSTGMNHLKPILDRLSGPIATEPPNPEGLRSSIDYLGSSMKGQSALSAKMKNLFGSEKIEHDPKSREDLKTHLDSLRENPEKLLEVGGSLGHYLPEHAAGLSYQAAVSTKYLESLKPKTQQLAPLDTPEATDKSAEAAYDRQLDLAQNPLLLIQHMKDGTLQPQDLTTVQTIYPGLHKAMVSEAMEALVEAKTKDTLIPYKKKMTLSQLLGQPLDFTQSPMAAQEILKSAALPPSQNSAKGPQKKSGATAATLKQINRVDEMDETSLQARQINRNKH